MGYYDVYQTRLSHYGKDRLSRITGQREKGFENFLKSSPSSVTFIYNGAELIGSLQRSKQDETRTICQLLLPLDCELDSGTVLDIPESETVSNKWMIWWKEDSQAKGYNRYIVVKLIHTITLQVEENKTIELNACLFGPGSKTLKDVSKSASNGAIYLENDNLYMLLMPFNKQLQKDGYFEMTYKDNKDAFSIKNVDIYSTLGISYVSADPTPLRESNKIFPSDDENISSNWINGGRK